MYLHPKTRAGSEWWLLLILSLDDAYKKCNFSDSFEIPFTANNSANFLEFEEPEERYASAEQLKTW